MLSGPTQRWVANNTYTRALNIQEEYAVWLRDGRREHGANVRGTFRRTFGGLRGIFGGFGSLLFHVELWRERLERQQFQLVDWRPGEDLNL